MAKVCSICGKGPVAGRTIKRRGMAKKKGGLGQRITGVSKRRFLPNLQRIRALVNGKPKKITVCVSCLKAGKAIKATRTARTIQTPQTPQTPQTDQTAQTDQTDQTAQTPQTPARRSPAERDAGGDQTDQTD